MKKWYLGAFILVFACSSAFSQGWLGKGAKAARGAKVPKVEVKVPNVRVPTPTGNVGRGAVTPTLKTRIANKLRKWEVVTSANLRSFIEGQKFVGVKESYMIENAIRDGRIVHFSVLDGVTRFYLERPINNPFYKEGPYFEFYDQALFQELDRSRALGLEIRAEAENSFVSVLFPEALAETPIVVNGTEMLLKEMTLDTIIPDLLRGHMGNDVFNGWYLLVDTYEGAAKTIAYEAKGLKRLNDWFEEFLAYRDRLKLNEGMQIHYNSKLKPAKFWLANAGEPPLAELRRLTDAEVEAFEAAGGVVDYEFELGPANESPDVNPAKRQETR